MMLSYHQRPPWSGWPFRTDDERPRAGSTSADCFTLAESLGGSRMPADVSAQATAEAAAAVDASFREEWGRIVATLIAATGDWDLAEECAQDAFARALQAWARDGVPARPGAWLTTTARNRAVDVLRRRANEAAKLERRPGSRRMTWPLPMCPTPTRAAFRTTGCG